MKKLLSFTALGFLLAVFFLAALPARGEESVDSRIKALEDELAQLKSEQQRVKAQQMEFRQDALAAKGKLPSIKYRPGSGLRITAPDKMWRIKFYGRQLVYMSFFDDNEPRGGLVQGALIIRRFRPGFNFEYYKRLVEWKFQIDSSSGGDGSQGFLKNFDSDLVVHFERINPWLPFLHFGDSPSVKLNPQDTNCSSKRCGRSERSFVNEGSGVTTGSMDRGIVLGWRKLPLGSAQISFLNFGFGMDQTNAFQEGEDNVENDSKTLTLGIGIKPFKKSKNKWLKGIELSFGGRFMKIAESNNDLKIRANQIRFERVEFVESSDIAGQQQYYTPGFGWKYGPYQLRVSGSFWRAHLERTAAPQFTASVSGDSNPGGQIGEEGAKLNATGFRILHEIWLWSPKGGAFTGNTKKGGLMISPMYQRADVDAAPGGLSRCNSSGSGSCKSVHVTNAGIWLWYYFGKRVWNIGFGWDHWRVNKANGGDEGAGTIVEKGKLGRPVSFNSFTFASRFHW